MLRRLAALPVRDDPRDPVDSGLREVLSRALLVGEMPITKKGQIVSKRCF